MNSVSLTLATYYAIGGDLWSWDFLHGDNRAFVKFVLLNHLSNSAFLTVNKVVGKNHRKGLIANQVGSG